MAIEWTNVIVAAITGLGSGAVGSLIAPWVNWRIEQKKEVINARRKFISDCRVELSRLQDINEIRRGSLYAQLRPHLDETLAKNIDSGAINVRLGSGRKSGANYFHPDLYDAVSKLEQKWKLL